MADFVQQKFGDRPGVLKSGPALQSLRDRWPGPSAEFEIMRTVFRKLFSDDWRNLSDSARRRRGVLRRPRVACTLPYHKNKTHLQRPVLLPVIQQGKQF